MIEKSNVMKYWSRNDEKKLEKENTEDENKLFQYFLKKNTKSEKKNFCKKKGQIVLKRSASYKVVQGSAWQLNGAQETGNVKKVRKVFKE